MHIPNAKPWHVGSTVVIAVDAYLRYMRDPLKRQQVFSGQIAQSHYELNTILPHNILYIYFWLSICNRKHVHISSIPENRCGLFSCLCNDSPDMSWSIATGTLQKRLPEKIFSDQLSTNLSKDRAAGLNVERRYDDFITQQPFELKLTMPPTDRGGRGYSDKYVAKVIKELLTKWA